MSYSNLQIMDGGETMYPCELKEQPAQPTLSVRFRAPVQELPQHFQKVYGAIMQYLGELGEQHAGAAFAAYHNLDMQNLEVEAGFPVSRSLPGKGEIQASIIPAGTFAVCHYTGPYDGTAAAFEQLTQFAKDQGYQVSGAPYEWYLNGPDTLPQDLKTDVVFPVTRIAESARV